MLFNYQDVNPLADQYSAAAVIYNLLTGDQVLDLPKEGRRRFTSLLRRQQIPIRERRPDISASLAEVLHKALARTPAQRHANAGAFRQALMKCLSET
jgi:serine/threonine protein kinase